MKRLFAISAVALMLAALGSALAGVGDDWLPPGVVVKATKIVRAKATFKKAILLEADGTPAKGAVTTAAAVTRWRIVFDNQATQGSKFRSVFVTATKGHFGKVTGNPEPFLEDRRITKIPKMTLATAVKKIRAAGHRQGFLAVTLRWPLQPGFNEPLYIFGFRINGQPAYWSVGTQTGRIRHLTS